MNQISIHDYSWTWRWRNVLVFFLLGAGLFSFVIIFKGISSLIDNQSSPLFFWFFITATKITKIYRARTLTKQVLIDGDTIKITRYNNVVTIFNFSEISQIKKLNKKDTINGFYVKEIVVKVHGKSDCVIPINISNFRSLYKRFKRRNNNVALPLNLKPSMDESFKKDPIKGFIFYFCATLFFVWVGLGLHKESKNIWLYGDVSTGIIRDKSISCEEPKIEVQGEMYRISNCENYPENVSLNVISMPDTKVKSVYVGVKDSSLNEFIKKRSGRMLAGASLFSLLMFSVSLMYLRKWREKT